MACAHYKCDNLCAMLDCNQFQIDGKTEDIMGLEPLADKWRAFNWHVIEIDGHDMDAVVQALEKVKTIKDKPTLILAHTIKGKGVSYMENVAVWHGKAPCAEEAACALEEIRSSCPDV